MHRVRVKYCGITRPCDAQFAASLGVDAIGLVFYERSPRAIDIAQAQDLVAVLPPFVTKVGLFVNERPARIEYVLDRVPLDLLQFHGDESPAECGRYARRYLKAVRMHAGVDLLAVARVYEHAAGLLVDSHVEGIYGGTGESFDWGLVKARIGLPLVLAGGLTPENVALAIRTVVPYGVDVSGGIESAKGIKDQEKMYAFMKGVHGG